MQPATTSQQALGNLQSAQASQKSPDQIYQQESGSLGLPAAQQQVTGLRGAINNTTSLLQRVVPSVMGRTGDSLVTSAQADRQVANEQAPLNTQLNQENQDYSGASTDYNNLLGQVNTLTGNDITGQQNQLSYLQGVYGDLSASEQAAVQNQLARDQLNAQKAAASGGGISLGGGLSGASGSSGSSGSAVPIVNSKNSAGGYSFTQGGTPVTMGQYLVSKGLSGQQLVAQAAQLLSQSNGGDKGIANAISSGRYTPAQLEKLYPQVFGGI